MFILWIFTALSKTLAQLQSRRQTAKLELYRRFTNTLAIAVVISVAWIGYVTLRARWVTLRARWVPLRARWVPLIFSKPYSVSSSAGGEQQSVATPQAARGWSRPSCRPFKIQSC